MELLGDRIARSTAVVPADALSVDVTAFHGFDGSGVSGGAALMELLSWPPGKPTGGLGKLPRRDCVGARFELLAWQLTKHALVRGNTEKGARKWANEAQPGRVTAILWRSGRVVTSSTWASSATGTGPSTALRSKPCCS
jgi:hypothetical protein